MKITKEQLLKLMKSVNRSLETPYRPSVIHKKSKKDNFDKKSNTIRKVDIDD